MKIAIAQINPIIGDFNYNFNKIMNFADRAKQLSCDLIVFPELDSSVSGDNNTFTGLRISTLSLRPVFS